MKKNKIINIIFMTLMMTEKKIDNYTESNKNKYQSKKYNKENKKKRRNIFKKRYYKVNYLNKKKIKMIIK